MAVKKSKKKNPIIVPNDWSNLLSFSDTADEQIRPINKVESDDYKAMLISSVLIFIGLVFSLAFFISK